MSSQARIDANRRNAQKSTGPRTPEGKARSSQNALRHGLASISHHRFLAAEDRTAFERILAGYVRIYQPAHADEVDLLTDAVFCKWRQQRAWSAEAQLIEMAVALNQRDLQKKLPKSQRRRSGRLRLYSLCGTNPTAPPLRGPVTSPISSQSQRVTRLTSLPYRPRIHP